MLETKKNATYTPPNRINFFIFYELHTWSQDLNSDFTLKDCLFGGVELTKSGYGIGFNSCSEFSLPDGRLGQIVIIFGVDMSSSVHIDHKGKDILIHGKGPTQGLDDIMLKAEAQYSIFQNQREKFKPALKWEQKFLFVNGTKNISIQSKKKKKKKLLLVFRKNFRRFFSQ